MRLYAQLAERDLAEARAGNPSTPQLAQLTSIACYVNETERPCYQCGDWTFYRIMIWNANRSAAHPVPFCGCTIDQTAAHTGRRFVDELIKGIK